MHSIGMLVLRIALGVIFIAHGWQKLNTNGMDKTKDAFKSMNIPVPDTAAWFAALVELIGGGALILGVLTPLFALLLAVDMAGAFWYVHRDAGVFIEKGGWELVVALFAGAVALMFGGAGKVSIDGIFGRVAWREGKGKDKSDAAADLGVPRNV